MPRVTTLKKQQTHEKIVRNAAHAIRKSGYDGVSVAAIMEQAGLTHGGFYAHFASRDAMLAEALDVASRDTLERLSRAPDAEGTLDALQAVVASYLSDRHVAAPENGCAIAALGSETRRQTAQVRRVATRRVKEMADMLERQMPGWGEAARHEDALAVMSCLVGAVVIARLVDDPSLSKALRRAAAKLVRDGVAARGPAQRRRRPAPRPEA